MADFNWTEAQRNIIQQAINDEIESSRLAHKLIPELTLAPDARTVPGDRYNYENDTIDENPIELLERAEEFSLPKLQTEDENLEKVKTRVRRAAQQLAREHDRVVFVTAIRDEIDKNAGSCGFHNIEIINHPFSDGLVAAATDAVASLDSEGYRTGYVMVAGQQVYTLLHTRASGAVDLPVKAVQGLLEDGPIHRSALLNDNEALILSISGEEIDRPISVAPTLEFLRVGDNADRVFRLYERFQTRFKQTYSVVLLRLENVEEEMALIARAPRTDVTNELAERMTAATEAAAAAAKAAAEAAKAIAAAVEAIAAKDK